MGRWGLAPVIGNGTSPVVPGQEATTGPYRPDLDEYASLGAWVNIIPPGTNWSLVYFQGNSSAVEDAVDSNSKLRFIPRDLTPESVLTPVQINFLNNWLSNHSIPVTITSGMTVHEAVTAIGSYLDPLFDRSAHKLYGP